jgi:hypothetical protein
VSAIATQEQQAAVGAVGSQLVGLVGDLGAPFVYVDQSDVERARAIGRMLMHAAFLGAATEGLNRVSLIEGVAQALGEGVAQQSDENRAYIMEAIAQAFAYGQACAISGFAARGNA